MSLIQNRVRPLILGNYAFDTLESAQDAYDDLVNQINDILTRALDDNTQRVEQWGNRLNRTTWNLMFMGG